MTLRKGTIAVLVIGACLSLCVKVRAKRTRLIADGLTMAGVVGKVSSAGQDRWFFEPALDLADERGRVFAGRRLELLPSAQLEKITADFKARGVSNYKIWGRVTRYRNENYLYTSYFLPLSKAKQAEPEGERSAQQQSRESLKVNEPDDPLVIPQHIVERLSRARPARSGPSAVVTDAAKLTWQPKKQQSTTTDAIVADRTGFFVETDGRWPEFSFDAIGRRRIEKTIKILGCEVLERAEQSRAAEAEPVRFKIAGVVTKYKGTDFILLQKATRVYDHGNFGR